MAKPKKDPVNPMLGTSPEARRRQAAHARDVKARKRKVAAAMKDILARQPELRAMAEAKLAREAAGEEPPFVLH